MDSSESKTKTRLRCSKHYNSIDLEKRLQLIRRAFAGQKIRKLSEELGIKLSTAKFIWKSFRQDGRIFVRKASKVDTEQADQMLQLRQKLDDSAQSAKKSVEFVYVPMVVPVLIQQYTTPTLDFPACQLYFDGREPQQKGLFPFQF